MADNLDIAVSFQTYGRIVIELFADTNTLTAENFRALCTGEKGIGKAGIPLHYKGSIIHTIVPDDAWHGGNITQGSDHLGGESIYGDQFPDEEWIRQHDSQGILSMGNYVGNLNGSQFILHTKVAPDYDEEQHVVFGKVVSGFEVINLVGQMVANEFSNPSEPVIIADCGPIFPEYVVKRVGYSGFLLESSAPAIYEKKLLNQLRAAQRKMGETEIAQAKQKIKYESDYDRAEALRRWPWLGLGINPGN